MNESDSKLVIKEERISQMEAEHKVVQRGKEWKT